GGGRHPLGAAQRRPLESPALGVSVPVHLLAPPRPVGRARRLARSLAGLPGHPARAGSARLGRVLRRWLVRPGKKGGDGVGKTKRGKGTKWMVVVDGQGVPLACHLDSASPAEVNLLERTLDNIDVQPADEGEEPPRPMRLICDKSYDSDGLRERLLFERDIELVSPHRR